MPSKGDCWTLKEWIPEHSIVWEFGITCRWFEFIWRPLHPSFDELDKNELNDLKEKEEISSDNLDKDNDLEDNFSDEGSINKCIQADQQDNLSGTSTIESI